MNDRLNEATGTTAAQMELNKKRESELDKMRKDLEAGKIQQDATIVSLKKKQLDAISEMSEQIELLSKMKAKYDIYQCLQNFIFFISGLTETKLRLWQKYQMFVLQLMK